MEPIATPILILNYLGDAVFAVSGALAAGRHRMDILGFALIGTITGIGGGTLRDLIIGRTVWWTQNPEELLLCVAVSIITYFFISEQVARKKWLNWSDAIGLACFAVVGSHIALSVGVSPIVAVFMGAMTATGGGLIRDVITGTKPMITEGQLYASAAILGSAAYVLLKQLDRGEYVAEAIAFSTCLLLRAAAIKFDIRMGPPGEFIQMGSNRKS